MWQRIGAVVVVGVVGLIVWSTGTSRPQAQAAQLSAAGFGGAGLITHVHDLEGRSLRVVVVDPAQRVMGVYDIARENGEIKLRSVRNLNADLQMMQFNSEELSPADIQRMLNQKK